jgi:acetyl esterase
VPVDPQLASMLAQLPPPTAPTDPSDLQSLIAAVRHTHEIKVATFTPPDQRDQVSAVEDITIPATAGDIPARVYRPRTAGPNATVVLAHGGGWVSGSLHTADVLARAVCRRAGVTVVSLQYSLAPERPFPHAVNEMSHATAWALDHDATLGGAGKVVVAGDSAGGNLAAVAALDPQLRARLAGQLLVYPSVALDAEPGTFASCSQIGAESGLNPQELDLALALYVPDPASRSHVAASPWRSPDLAEAPPAVVVVCEVDPLHDEGVHYARMLQDAGVPTTLLDLQGMIHGAFDMIGGSTTASAAMDQTSAALVALLDAVPALTVNA